MPLYEFEGRVPQIAEDAYVPSDNAEASGLEDRVEV